MHVTTWVVPAGMAAAAKAVSAPPPVPENEQLVAVAGLLPLFVRMIVHAGAVPDWQLTAVALT